MINATTVVEKSYPLRWRWTPGGSVGDEGGTSGGGQQATAIAI